MCFICCYSQCFFKNLNIYNKKIMENNNEIREMIDRVKNFGTIHVNIDGNAYPRDMIVRDIKLVLENYLSDNHLFVNGTEIELKPNPHKH